MTHVIRSLLLIGAGLACLATSVFACEQRFSATSPADTLAPALTSDAGEAWLTQPVVDAGPVAVDSSHAMTLTACASNRQACPEPDSDGSVPATYRVVFASGRGVIRSREQAMTDLYRELRDRMTTGERLTIHSAARRDGGAASRPKGGSAAATSPDNDAFVQSAQRLLEVVDGSGEVTIDVVRGKSFGCMLLLAPSVPVPDDDGGASSCLIKEPERPSKRSPGGISF